MCRAGRIDGAARTTAIDVVRREAEPARRVLEAGRQHEVAQPVPVAALQVRREQRAEGDLLAVLRGAGVQRVERVADQVLGPGARARRAGDLHREAAEHEPAQQAVQELLGGRAGRGLGAAV